MAGQRISVPDFVGFGWEEAHEMARAAGLSTRAVGPDGQAVNGRGGVVIDQKPAAGDKVAVESEVALRVAFGGGPAGNREPRVPLPDPRELEEWVNMPLTPDISGRGSDREPALAGKP